MRLRDRAAWFSVVGLLVGLLVNVAYLESSFSVGGRAGWAKTEFGVVPSLELVLIDQAPNDVKMPRHSLLIGNLFAPHSYRLVQNVTGGEYEPRCSWSHVLIYRNPRLVQLAADCLRLSQRGFFGHQVSDSYAIGGYGGASVFESKFKFHVESCWRRINQRLGQFGALSIDPRPISYPQSLVSRLSGTVGGFAGSFGGGSGSVHLLPLQVGVMDGSCQQCDSQQREEGGNCYGTPIGPRVGEKARAAVSACLFACSFFLGFYGFWLVYTCGGVEDVGIINMTRMISGAVLLLVFWLVFHGALDILDFGTIYLEHLLI